MRDALINAILFLLVITFNHFVRPRFKRMFGTPPIVETPNAVSVILPVKQNRHVMLYE